MQTGHRGTELFMTMIDMMNIEGMLGLGLLMDGMVRVEQDTAIMVEHSPDNRKVDTVTIMSHLMSMKYLCITHTQCYPQTARGE